MKQIPPNLQLNKKISFSFSLQSLKGVVGTAIILLWGLENYEMEKLQNNYKKLVHLWKYIQSQK